MSPSNSGGTSFPLLLRIAQERSVALQLILLQQGSLSIVRFGMFGGQVHEITGGLVQDQGGRAVAFLHVAEVVQDTVLHHASLPRRMLVRPTVHDVKIQVESREHINLHPGLGGPLNDLRGPTLRIKDELVGAVLPPIDLAMLIREDDDLIRQTGTTLLVPAVQGADAHGLDPHHIRDDVVARNDYCHSKELLDCTRAIDLQTVQEVFVEGFVPTGQALSLVLFGQLREGHDGLVPPLDTYVCVYVCMCVYVYVCLPANINLRVSEGVSQN